MRSLQIESNPQQRLHQMPFGASIEANGSIHFHLPALSAKTVDLLLYNTAESETKLPLKKIADGRFELITDQAHIGSNYKFLIDNEITIPDPASRHQVDTIHGPSQVIDPRSYTWTTLNWKGKDWEEVIIYELHVGTFTEKGTFAAVEEKLDYLLQLGITAIELMPIADFPGQRNWGYDGVLFFAPAKRYGTPDQLKHLIDLCHQKGLMIFLDVVYNHFGPEGNYLHTYAKNFFNDKYKTPWGAALNFDAQDSSSVRDFMVNNALYWINEFYFDGLRLDAVHAIHDASSKHIVMEICEAIRTGPGVERQIHIILENDNNDVKFLQSDLQHQPSYATAQWNDDIHHVFHVIATDEKEGYYADYCDSEHSHTPKDTAICKLGRALSEGFVYQGETSIYRKGEHRGEPSKHLPATDFISFLQNHDQIGNRAFGERLCSIADHNKLKVLTALFLLAPAIPMLFMGEEWAANTPFLYFCNLGPDLAPLVTAGRRKEFENFSIFREEEQRESIPDPCAIYTYEASILNWQEKHEAEHKEWLSFYEQLIHLRKTVIIPLLKKLEPGKGMFSVLPNNLLKVSWPLKDGQHLTVLVHPSNEIIPVNNNWLPSNTAKYIFQQPINFSQTLIAGTVPPHSIAWYLA